MKFVTALVVAGALATPMLAAAVPAGGTAAPDPAGDVIVECVTLAAVLNASQPPNSNPASIPQNPLGPLKCWPKDNRPIQ
jgi:hypothetical protein